MEKELKTHSQKGKGIKIDKLLHIPTDSPEGSSPWHYLCKGNLNFDYVSEKFEKSLKKQEYYGAMSLVYWRYYEEMSAFVENVVQDIRSVKRYAKPMKKFYKKFLSKWLVYMRGKGTEKYVQYAAFQKMERLINETYF